MTHWTGSKKRLDRNLQNSFGSKNYAFEELVAELGSAFLLATLNVEGEYQHESYIESWLKKLKDDNKFIFKASSLASQTRESLKDVA